MDGGGTSGDAVADTSVDGPSAVTGFPAPVWFRTIQGALGYTPLIGFASDGTVVGSTAYGDFAKSITLGAGEPNEITLAGPFKVAVAWFDGATGNLVRARKVAEDSSSATQGAVQLHGMDLGPSDSVHLAGNWVRTVVFHQGTSIEHTWTAATSVIGGVINQADDPFVTAYSSGGSPRWIVRGRTPSPVLANMVGNWSECITALPGGGALFMGQYDGAGFVFADGTSASRTFTGARGTYFALLDDTGMPTRVNYNAGGPYYSRMGHAADGSVALVGQLFGDTTLLADTPTPISVKADPSSPSNLRSTFLVVTIAPGGTVAWTRKIVEELPYTFEIAVRRDGSLVLSGTCSGVLDFRDAADAVAMQHTCSAPMAFVASYDATGNLEWVTFLDPSVTSGASVDVDASGTAYVVAWTRNTSVTELTLDGPAPLALMPAPAGARAYTVIYEVTRAGKRSRARLIGTDLSVTDIALSASRAIAIAGGYSADSLPRIGDGRGAFVDLPGADANADQRALFATFAP
jgi:hypothetical protein